jgi:hypothetical protein
MRSAREFCWWERTPTPYLAALEAVARESDHFIRAYRLSDLLDSELKDYLIHPVTHNPVNPLDLPFIHLNEHRALTVIIDDEKRIADRQDKNAPLHEDIEKMLVRLDASQRHIYLVSKGQPNPTATQGHRTHHSHRVSAGNVPGAGMAATARSPRAKG